VDLVTGALARGGAPPVAVAVRDAVVDLVQLRGVPQVPRFLAALTRSTRGEAGAPSAVGLMGTLPTATRDGAQGPWLAAVFLEWPDCRWWYWRALLDADRKEIVPGTATWSRAVDGDRMPARLGRWWTIGRRARLGLVFRVDEPVVH
jgi:hypothetical protein